MCILARNPCTIHSFSEIYTLSGTTKLVMSKRHYLGVRKQKSYWTNTIIRCLLEQCCNSKAKTECKDREKSIDKGDTKTRQILRQARGLNTIANLPVSWLLYLLIPISFIETTNHPISKFECIHIFFRYYICTRIFLHSPFQ